MSRAITPTTAGLAFPAEAPALRFTGDQRAMIRGMIARSDGQAISEEELAPLVAVAELRRLNPLLRQIWFVKRAGQWTPMVSIDGLRLIAQRSGRYAGQSEPEYVHDTAGKLVACKVAVYRSDWPADRPAWGVAYLREYADARSPFWRDKPYLMVAKVSEALALRKGFPDETSGLYVTEEMEKPLSRTPQPPAVAQRSPAPPPVVQASTPQPPAATTATPQPAGVRDGEFVDVGPAPWAPVLDALRAQLMACSDLATLDAIGRELKAAIDPARGAARLPAAAYQGLRALGAQRRAELMEDQIPF